MALPRSFLLFLSLLLLTQLSSFVSAAPWIVTADYEEAVYTETYAYETLTDTQIEQITPTATSMPQAISTITSTGTSGYYDEDVTIIQKLYPTGVGSNVYDDNYGYGDGYGYGDEDEYQSTMFAVNLTYTAPTGCSSQWTQTTAVEVIPPAEVQDLLPRTAVATSISVDSSEPFQPTTYTIDIVYVDPTQIPSSSLESMSRYNRPTSLYSGSGCAYTGTGGSEYNYGYYNYGYDDGYGNWFTDSYWIGISPLALTLILSIGWIGLFLICGFIEAWVRFRRLMMGWQTRRGLPVCWALTIMPITLLLLCFFRKGYRARSQADGEILKKRWKAMGFGTKLRLFFVWGFRFKYPPMLGPAPARVKTSKQPEKNPGPRLLEESPVPSEAPQSRDGSTAAPADLPAVATASAASAASTADPEMATTSPAPVENEEPQAQAAAASGALPHHQDEESGRPN
ncbi:hypothetical protein BO70DRAFT_364480 [Aspergillus heteromorphus CBS 117.55]|uniref:Uncharacterized protein n=1 Tax=Aspergillus heteromorphus CBS 117.55 TaxID=1448321 RepID=A0A317VK98_9EURO|nr:uncharacterized protein BO70DRAFT_364480 [Aspergillus heteromorphus CBS 117.55]PWY73587.1 hypothetical protein BO70DRAFT_364480 [Aspergillus heteromorphus CBS 117.55]